MKKANLCISLFMLFLVGCSSTKYYVYENSSEIENLISGKTVYGFYTENKYREGVLFPFWQDSPTYKFIRYYGKDHIVIEKEIDSGNMKSSQWDVRNISKQIHFGMNKGEYRNTISLCDDLSCEVVKKTIKKVKNGYKEKITFSNSYKKWATVYLTTAYVKKNSKRQ